jgi:hypothetical protein
MDFVNRLKPDHLQSFWYFASKVNFALVGTFGSLLWATAPGKEEAEFYKMRLAEYRWTLTVSMKGAAGFMGFAVAMLDTSTSLLARLPDKPTLSRPPSEEDVEDGGTRNMKVERKSVSVGSMVPVWSGRNGPAVNDMSEDAFMVDADAGPEGYGSEVAGRSTRENTEGGESPSECSSGDSAEFAAAGGRGGPVGIDY